MADIELPLKAWVTHPDALHRTEDDAGDPIPEGWLHGADGARGHIYYDPSNLGSTDAADINVTDSAGYFTGTNVETILAELGALVEGVQAHGNTGSTETFAATTGVHTATLDANCTFTFTALASGLASGMVLILTQDGTGSRTVTWPGSVVWPGGAAPTLSTAAASVDVLTFLSVDGGTTWFGFPTGGGSAVALSDDDPLPDGTADPGVSTEGSRSDHVHPAAAAPIPRAVLLASDHATPFTFDDMLQASDGSGFLYASE